MAAWRPKASVPPFDCCSARLNVRTTGYAGPMTDATPEDPAIVGDRPETSEQIKPPVADDTADASTAHDQLLEDAEGGIEGSLLDAPEEGDITPI